MKPRTAIALALLIGGVLAYGHFSHEQEQAPVTVCFAPEGRCAQLAIEALDAAMQQIRGHAYSFTKASGFGDALVRAKERGVDVSVIVDRTIPCSQGSAVPMVLKAGIPVLVDSEPPIAHEKAWIIDGHLVAAGSFNWSAQASLNSEDLNFINDPQIAAAYLDHWDQRYSLSTPADLGTCKHPPQGTEP